MTHVGERDAKRAACKSNPGAARNDDECVNAEQAWVRSTEKADVPKVDFQKKPAALVLQSHDVDQRFL